MNKRPVLIFLASVIFTFVSVSQTFSQGEFNFEKSLSDYTFTRDVYQKEHSDYLLARSQFLQARTLASETKAIDETRQMLMARDDVIRTYLTALRLRIIEAEGIDQNSKESTFARLDSEIAWFNDHRERVQSAGTLDDLVLDSKEASDHYLEFSEQVIFESLSILPIGKVAILRENMTEILNNAQLKTEKIRQIGDHDTSIVERWIGQTDNTLARSLDKELDSRELVIRIQSGINERGRRDTNYRQTHEQILSLTQDSLQLLKDSNGFLKEVISALRTKS